MREAAEELDFERAIAFRDTIKNFRKKIEGW
jgi:excinuclease UvrABC helicase subunit UvrB